MFASGICRLGCFFIQLKKIDLSLYNEFTNMSFGAEEIQNIQLLAMLKKKQNDGYYHSECEINISESINGRLHDYIYTAPSASLKYLLLNSKHA